MKRWISWVCKHNGVTYDGLTEAVLVHGCRGMIERGMHIEPDTQDKFEEIDTTIEIETGEIDFKKLPDDVKSALNTAKEKALEEELKWQENEHEEW